MFRLLAFSLFCLCVSHTTFAAIVVSYDLTGQPGDQVFVAGNAPSAGITPLNLTRGAGLGVTTTSDSMSSNSWNSAETATPDIADEYFSFGFGVDSLTIVTLTNVQLRTRSSNTGPGTFDIFSSLDDFATSLGSFSQPASGDLDSTIDLSSFAAVSNVNVEFRIIEAGNTQADGVGTTSGGGTFRIENFNGSASSPFTINGTITAVPEPSSIAMLLVATGGVMVRRRRR